MIVLLIKVICSSMQRPFLIAEVYCNCINFKYFLLREPGILASTFLHYPSIRASECCECHLICSPTTTQCAFSPRLPVGAKLFVYRTLKGGKEGCESPPTTAGNKRCQERMALPPAAYDFTARTATRGSDAGRRASDPGTSMDFGRLGAHGDRRAAVAGVGNSQFISAVMPGVS